MGEWQQAGLYDPDAPAAADRLALLEFLDSLGCTLDEMVVSDRQGRLFALSGDRVIRPGTRRWSTADASRETGLEAALLERFWRALGLPDPDGTLSDEDLEALRMVAAYRALVGDDAALGLARVLGGAISRIAEAGSSAIRSGFSQVALTVSGSEVATARAYADITALVPGVVRLMDSAYRHHLDVARKHFEAVEGDTVGLTVRCGVAFADLSGFTTMSGQLELAELSTLLVGFEEHASDVVHSGGGRVVKFLGDAVMFVSSDPVRLVAIARDLVLHPAAVEVGVVVRAGCAFGEVLAQDGDYFGTPVNLAARLADSAEPGEVLVDEACAKRLGTSQSLGDGEPRVLRGFADPVPAYPVVLPLR